MASPLILTVATFFVASMLVAKTRGVRYRVLEDMAISNGIKVQANRKGGERIKI